MGGESADGTGGERVGAVEDVGRGPEPVDPDPCGPGPGADDPARGNGTADGSGRRGPEPVERPRADPPTSPIPVVPALNALGRYPTGGYSAASVDRYPTGVHRSAADRGVIDPYAAAPAAPPPSSTETTMVWRLSDDPAAYAPVTDTGRHHRRLAPAGW